MYVYVHSAYLALPSLPLRGERQVHPQGTLGPLQHLSLHLGNHPGQQHMLETSVLRGLLLPAIDLGTSQMCGEYSLVLAVVPGTEAGGWRMGYGERGTGAGPLVSGFVHSGLGAQSCRYQVPIREQSVSVGKGGYYQLTAKPWWLYGRIVSGSMTSCMTVGVERRSVRAARSSSSSDRSSISGS